RRYVISVSKVRPETSTVGESCTMLIGAVVNVGNVLKSTVPPLPATFPLAQLAALLQFPPGVPTSAIHVPFVCPRELDGTETRAAAIRIRRAERARIHSSFKQFAIPTGDRIAGG